MRGGKDERYEGRRLRRLGAPACRTAAQLRQDARAGEDGSSCKGGTLIHLRGHCCWPRALLILGKSLWQGCKHVGGGSVPVAATAGGRDDAERVASM